MPKVTAFMLADDVTGLQVNSDRQVPALVNPHAVLRPKYIPSTFSFSFSICIIDVDVDNPLELKMVIEDPTGAPIQEPLNINVSQKIRIQDDSLPSEYRSITANVSVRNLPLATSGIYYLVPYVNSEPLEKQMIPVFIQPPQ